ncbi:MAG: ornithine carbamoyltransferase [Alphaproteobacteria bacterium]|nr:ornithine carbamoyltransferase [Alphaproteobacteria bacterium]MCB1551014.1 ornithine carbamoyltransferase [Alphaproteobacteria bacterium]MCB9985860.1 ornithine carbamoyltransferase [Micavibrio sp.]HPQ50553.1 ornithine carbamoyltransferase [Alphaproteobacteria bacterium]HRK97507.1 ornithine carbamoyltransferase [Alphaproteobacteria bacterium]
MIQTPNHFINLNEIPTQTIREIMGHGHRLKQQKFAPPQLFDGMSLAMIFDKKSTRTRLSFEVAMKQLGGHTIVMGIDEIQLGGAESVEDTAKVLSRFVDGVMIRIGNHELVEELATHSSIPVINALTNESHPCQIMADMMTIEEKFGSTSGVKIAWMGDYNNVAKTFIQAAPKFGFELVMAIPPSLQPDSSNLNGIKIVDDPYEAAEHANVIVTDTWVSMGQEGKGTQIFQPYQVTKKLMAAANPDAIFMHCMPIHRGEEVTDEVLSTPACVIYDEAENRLHAQKAILAWCFENSGVRVHYRNQNANPRDNTRQSKQP